MLLHRFPAGTFSGSGGGTITRYRDTVLADGPLGYWRLNDVNAVAADVTGNGDGSFVNGPLGFTQGVAGPTHDTGATGTLFVRANNGRARVPFRAALGLANGPLTLEAWVKLSGGANPANNQSIVAMFNSYAMNLQGSGVSFTLAFFYSQHAIIITSASVGKTVPVDGNWHHVAATKNGAVSKLYIDGQDASGTDNDAVIANSGVGIGIGSENADLNADDFDGSIAEVAIYGTALTPARILAHFNAA